MDLKEFKEKIDNMYKKYGNLDHVTIDLTLDEEEDYTVTKCDDGNIWTENIQDITEIKDQDGVCGICLSNYIMPDNNWK